MKEIRADAKNLRALLGGAKFAIDYYQREYQWEKKHVVELINDLAEQFLDSHEAGNDRSAVENYGHYFLGSVIVSDKESRKYLIDGQQRLTTLTLLLIYIYRQLQDENQKTQIADLIFSQKYGRRSFNLDIEERAQCMEALFTGAPFDENGQPDSVVNTLNRYQDIEELFPDELRGETLPYFADWLIENVYLVEITAYSDTDAYTIFETMNDRGLSLTPTDMLKGYLLNNITDTKRRSAASSIWQKRIAALRALGKDEDADSIKAWLRSQYAKTIRERKRDAQPQDFDLIGTEFHRWVRDHEKDLGLTGSAAFARFIEEDFAFYTNWYERIREAADELKAGLEAIYFNAQHEFTLQYPVLLAPLCRTDSERVILRKLRVVASYLDILINRRIWNWRAIDYRTMQYAMFLVMREIRSQDLPKLVELLAKRLNEDKEGFASNDRFRLHGTNGRQIHRILARMTDYVETQSGRPSRYKEYIQRSGRNGYQIEHIWAYHPERHAHEFAHPTDFDEYRNRIGGLLLLPRSFNASYGDLEYGEKREYYLKHNLLAASLHENAYEHDPGFVRFVENSGLPFQPHPEFKKADLDARQELFICLAEQIWNPERLAREAEL
ncbi:MAG: Uncharacterized protein XD80_1318 [Synergistales bacterium 53_16]|nr:MAG: Uncharacterized protein XD80_1318 [Synergistales bacterium 53_16]